MRRIILTISILLGSVLVAAAQPRALGVRIGATGLDVSYEHSMNKAQFIEGNLGLDFGYNANGRAGIKANATYNFIWARPAWTQKGTWALYAGPGLSLGFVDDMVPYQIGTVITGYNDNGFMIGLAAQVGIEYTFDFPLQLAIDLRPCFGLHVNDGRFRIPEQNRYVSYESKVGFYDNGLLGFAPSIAVRYRF